MVPDTPADALGSHTVLVRSLIIQTVRDRHKCMVEAHQAASTRYQTLFASQWRDLLVDVCDALTSHGYPSYKLVPAGYRLGVVNRSLIYPWRVPATQHDVSKFASSLTRKNSFTALPPQAMLFGTDSGLVESTPADDDSAQEAVLAELEARAAAEAMPLVLVLIGSSPHQLSFIDWAIAMPGEDGQSVLSGRERLWEQHAQSVSGPASSVEAQAFNSGTPDVPHVSLRAQDRPEPDA